jgi:hypothetical protein
MAIVSLILALFALPARADVTLSPLRQVITRETPLAIYEVTNSSKRIVEGRVGWIDLKATETGYAPAPPELRARLSAAPYLTVRPASFRLEPGARTKIAVRLRKGVAIPRGERRSHLLIETAAMRTPLRKTSGSLELDIDMGLSTPVILRGEAARPAARLGDTKLLRNAEGLLDLETHVHAESVVTPYGRLEVTMRPKNGAPAQVIGRLANIAPYPDAKRRRVVVPLHLEHLPEGDMEIRFLGSAEFEGMNFAARKFDIAPAE